MFSFPTRLAAGAAVAAGLAALTGCSSGPAFVPVSGRVTVNGKPAEKVHVQFHPDATKGAQGPMSTADTDDDGRFTLAYFYDDRPGSGATVGWHKVVLQDLKLAESETGRGVPVRFGNEYATVLTTPLDREVTAEGQPIDIALPAPR